LSELIETGAPPRKETLKHLILELHAGKAPEAVQRQLVSALGRVPYGLVVEVEQELVEEGLPVSEVKQLCHLHAQALGGAIDVGAARRPPRGHPAQVLAAENAALAREAELLVHACDALEALAPGEDPGPAVLRARVRLNALADVDKHYLRKEHLLFPFLEKHGITAPPQVMWGKHDETRALLKGALAALGSRVQDAAAARAISAGALRPVAEAVRGMVEKEELILLPMCLDVLDELEWWEVARQSDDYGYCLVEPEASWRPESVPEGAAEAGAGGRVKLPTGSMLPAELEAVLGALPLDATFVDADDRVRWFSHGNDRVFTRSKAVLGRKVQLCHPPSSVDTVDRILAGFRAGTHDAAAFWIELRGRFVHIEYRALRGAGGQYLGCLEVTQDLTEKRALTGEQRLLSWDETARPARVEPRHPERSSDPARRALPVSTAPAPAVTACADAGCAPAAHGGPGPAACGTQAGCRPAWLDGARIAKRLDARPLLAQGIHPLQQVMQDLATLGPSDVYELVAPFVPGPLVERARSLGCLAHVEEEGGGLVRTFFTRGASA
jgi:DUF438 domain-containing protein